MKSVVVAFLLVLGLVVPAVAGDYSYDHTPDLVFPGRHGGIVHFSPYPQSRRAASVWQSDLCWQGCTSSCTWKMESCVAASDADVCRPHFDACDRACQRTCRLRGGPLLPDFFEGQ
jgi:hypothetical protein